MAHGKKCLILKMVGGEEIMGMVEVQKGNAAYGLFGLDAKTVHITNPVTLLVKPVEEIEGQYHLAMTPWVAFSQTGEIPIFPHSIVAVYEPEEGIAQDYLDTYGDIDNMITFTSAKQLNETKH
jgi:hypothetical protein